MAEEMHDLAAAYSLDALDDLERRRFDAHLAECPACRDEVASFGDALAEMAARDPEQPPAEMRERVMTRLAATPQAGASVAHPKPRRRFVVATSAAAAVAVVAVAAVLASGILTDDPIGAVLAAGDARQITLESETIQGATLTFSPELGEAVFTAADLAPLGADETYELWLIDDAGPRPAGLFSPDANGAAQVLVEGEVLEGLTLGLTVEPVAGSEAPTGEILIAHAIS